MTNLMRTTKPNFNRHALATQAMQAAIATRAKAKLDQHGPICIYGLSETLGVTVRFNTINMEGMYQRGAPPRIHLSARRPLPRRAYNCAHELGHHVFGHGSSIDELREDAKEHPWEELQGIPRRHLCGLHADADHGSAPRLRHARLGARDRDGGANVHNRLRFRRRLRDAPHPPLGRREHDLFLSRCCPAARHAKGSAGRRP